MVNGLGGFSESGRVARAACDPVRARFRRVHRRLEVGDSTRAGRSFLSDMSYKVAKWERSAEVEVAVCSVPHQCYLYCVLDVTAWRHRLEFKSSRPTYAIILFVLSGLWLCAAILPLFYSLLFPNADLQGVVLALRGRQTLPPASASVVREIVGSFGLLRRAVPVGYYSGVTATVRADGKNSAARIWQVSYIGWFQKLPKPIVIAISCYETEKGEKVYESSEPSLASVVRAYVSPLILFGTSIFLARRKIVPGPEHL